VLDKETSRLSRLIAILTQLQSKRLLTSTEVAQKFNVSVRTVYRDIKALEQAGVPHNNRGWERIFVNGWLQAAANNVYRKRSECFYNRRKTCFVKHDTSLTKNYIEGVTKIKSVLRTHAKDKAGLLSKRVAFEQNPDNKIVSNFLSTIQIALTNFSVIKIEYYSPNNDETTKRHIEPFALINNVGESWYLIAWCRLRKDYRLFRFDRITKMEVTDEKFAPHKITLQEYLARYRNNF